MTIRIQHDTPVTQEKMDGFFELIEFTVTRRIPGESKTRKGLYGVNVAKVREVIRMPKINPIASRLKGVAGVFELRGIPIAAINLAQVLGDVQAPLTDDQQIIITEFSLRRAGFIVSSTNRIRRISWDKVLPPTGGCESGVTGLTLIEDNEFLFILDLEKVISEIEEASGFVPFFRDTNAQELVSGIAPASARSAEAPNAQSGPRVLFVEDSKVVLNYARTVLRKAGFSIIEALDGRQALDILTTIAKQGRPEEKINVVVTDVEMPRMDGFGLVRAMKENPQLKNLPVLFHTSLSSYAIKESVENIGAQGLVVKNDWMRLIELLKEYSPAEKCKIGA